MTTFATGTLSCDAAPLVALRPKADDQSTTCIEAVQPLQLHGGAGRLYSRGCSKSRALIGRRTG